MTAWVAILTLASAAGAADGELGFSTDPAQLRAEVVESLVAELGSADPKKGRAAAERLVRFGRSAVPALVKALRDPRVQVRFYAASALDLIGGQAAAAALLGVLSDERESPLVRRIAAGAMGRAEHRPAAPVLLALARGAYPGAAGPGKEGASKPAEGARAESPLAGDEAFRFEVVRALALLGPAEADDVLVMALSDPSPRIREAAAQGLGDGRVLAGLEPLRKALADPDAAVAAAAAQALGKLGPAAFAAVDELIEALGRPDARVRRAATGALAIATGRSFPTQAKWREWWRARKGGPEAAAGAAGEPGSTTTAGPGGYMSGRLHEEPAQPASSATAPALRPPWEWDDRDWREQPSE